MIKVTAKDVMQRNVRTVRSDLSIADLERRFVDENVSGFPVLDGDDTVKGVVSASDVLTHLCEERSDVEMSTAFYDEDSRMEFTSVADDWVSAEVGKRTDHLRVRDVMHHDVVSVTSDTLLHDVAKLMTKEQIHRVLVIDDRRLVGIVSSFDIVRACGNESIEISFAAPRILDF